MSMRLIMGGSLAALALWALAAVMDLVPANSASADTTALPWDDDSPLFPRTSTPNLNEEALALLTLDTTLTLQQRRIDAIRARLTQMDIYPNFYRSRLTRRASRHGAHNHSHFYSSGYIVDMLDIPDQSVSASAVGSIGDRISDMERAIAASEARLGQLEARSR